MPYALALSEVSNQEDSYFRTAEHVLPPIPSWDSARAGDVVSIEEVSVTPVTVSAQVMAVQVDDEYDFPGNDEPSAASERHFKVSKVKISGKAHQKVISKNRAANNGLQHAEKVVPKITSRFSAERVASNLRSKIAYWTELSTPLHPESDEKRKLKNKICVYQRRLQ